MSAELQRALLEALKGLLVTVSSATGWAQGQLPLIVQEKLRYEILQVWFELGCLTLVLIIGIIWAALWQRSYTAVRLEKDSHYDNDDWRLPVGYIPLGIIILVWIIACCLDISALIQLYYAPRVFILEWVRTLIR